MTGHTIRFHSTFNVGCWPTFKRCRSALGFWRGFMFIQASPGLGSGWPTGLGWGWRGRAVLKTTSAHRFGIFSFLFTIPKIRCLELGRSPARDAASTRWLASSSRIANGAATGRDPGIARAYCVYIYIRPRLLFSFLLFITLYATVTLYFYYLLESRPPVPLYNESGKRQRISGEARIFLDDIRHPSIYFGFPVVLFFPLFFGARLNLKPPLSSTFIRSSLPPSRPLTFWNP